MWSGPGLPGLPRRSRSPATGAGHAVRSGVACRRALPLVLRSRARLSASTTATTCCCPAIGRRSPMSSGSARSTRSSGRPRRRSRLSTSPTGARWDGAAVARRRALVDFPSVAAGAGDASARLSRGVARSDGPAPATRSRRCWTAARRCSAGCGSRSSSRRSIPRPSRPRPRLFCRILAETHRPRRGRVPADAGARRTVGKPRRSGAGIPDPSGGGDSLRQRG